MLALVHIHDVFCVNMLAHNYLLDYLYYKYFPSIYPYQHALLDLASIQKYTFICTDECDKSHLINLLLRAGIGLTCVLYYSQRKMSTNIFW